MVKFLGLLAFAAAFFPVRRLLPRTTSAIVFVKAALFTMRAGQQFVAALAV